MPVELLELDSVVLATFLFDKMKQLSTFLLKIKVVHKDFLDQKVYQLSQRRCSKIASVKFNDAWEADEIRFR